MEWFIANEYITVSLIADIESFVAAAEVVVAVGTKGVLPKLIPCII